MFAVESFHAQARIVTDTVQTRSTILARPRRTIVRVHRAVTSLIALGANAFVGTGRVAARCSVATRRRLGALVDVLAAQSAGVAEWTGARVVLVVGRWRAFGSVVAATRSVNTGRARVHLGFTVATGKRRDANALVAVHQVDAGSIVAAWVRHAVVDVCLAERTLVAGHARAGERIEAVPANATVLTWVRTALIDVMLTAFATVAGWTVTDELVDTVLAFAAIFAWIRRTLVYVA